MAQEGISRQEAVFWMNIQLELLAVDQLALRRMRTLLLQTPEQFHGEDDIQFMEAESQRVLGQLAYWEETVDRLRAGPADAAKAKGSKALRVAEVGVPVERRRADPHRIQEPARSGSRTAVRPNALGSLRGLSRLR